MRRIQKRIIPIPAIALSFLIITLYLWWVGFGTEAVRQQSDWADLNRQVETLYAQGHYKRAIPYFQLRRQPQS